MKSFAVIGLGRFGSRLARKLGESGAEVLAIDRVQRNVNEIADDVTRAVVANVQDRDVLSELGVAECDCAILCIGSDLAGSVMGVMNLKAIGVQNMYCKAYDETHRQILTKLGADHVVIPEQEFADKLTEQLTAPGLQDYLDLPNDYSVAEIKLPKNWSDKTIRELNIRNTYYLTIIGIKRQTNFIVSPHADEKLFKGDVLVVIGKHDAIKSVEKKKKAMELL